jgi:hypothetical protein
LTRIAVPDTNPLPVSVSEAVPPATAWVGLDALSVGTGLIRVNVYEVVSADALVK